VLKAFFKVFSGIFCCALLLNTGWPVPVRASPLVEIAQADGFPRTEPGTIDFAGPAVVDLNQDGQLEVLVADSGGCVWGWDARGNTLSNFPLAPFGKCGARTRINSFAVGNIDGDGELEIVAGTAGTGESAGSRGKVFAWNSNGRMVDGWPREMDWNQAHGNGQPEVYSVILANITGDDRLEVVAGTSNNSSAGGSTDEATPNLYVWSGNGALLEGYPTWHRRAGIYGMLGAGDLNADGCMEVVAPRDHRWLHAYNRNGQYLRGWPVETWVDPNDRRDAPYLEFTRNAPALADLNKDGSVEVVIAGRVKQAESVTGGEVVIINSGVGIYEPSGERMTGWRVSKLGDGPPLTKNYGPSQAPALADLNGDGHLEVVVTLMDGTARAYRADGTMLWKYSFAHGTRLAASEPVIGDIDGDRQLDVVFGTYSPDGSATHAVGVVALSASSGGLKAGFPLSLANENGAKKGIRSTPVLSDLDRDGNVDIIAGSWSGALYVWKMNAPYRAAFMPWPTGRQNNQRTGSFMEAAGTQSVEALPGVSQGFEAQDLPGLGGAGATINFAYKIQLPKVDRPGTCQ